MEIIIINHGSQDIEELGFEQAYKNMKVFIEDCEIELFIAQARLTPEDNGRYFFELKTPLSREVFWEIEMPSLPLEKVRFINEKSQNIWDFPRLYVDGSSWVWKYAIITKNSLIDQFEAKIEEYNYQINTYTELINDLKRK